MPAQNIVELFTHDQRLAVRYPDTRREVTPTVVRHLPLVAGQGDGSIIYSRLDETNVEAEIQTQIDYFENLGLSFEWKVYDYDRPADLKERLAAFGFALEEAEAIMVLELAETGPLLSQTIQPDIRRLTAPEQLADVLVVEQAVWDSDQQWLVDYLGDCLSGTPEQMSVYVAYVEAQPVSAAWIYFPPDSQFASLWGGSTLAEFRGRGLYSALLAVRAQEAKRRGINYLTVDASPMSRPVLEKFGFEVIAEATPCKWMVQPE
ncbi:MAG TPA: GNAT family N-acetyltransferase [Anaerolineae bacterium]|nr:GNAT family N-acetyltransferase [Anaerolineae bacterium]